MGIISDELKKRGMKLVDLARELRVNKATVTRWDQKGVPTDRLREVEGATGISPREQRPDLASIFDAAPLDVQRQAEAAQ